MAEVVLFHHAQGLTPGVEFGKKHHREIDTVEGYNLLILLNLLPPNTNLRCYTASA